jgi:hypothetical protein
LVNYLTNDGKDTYAGFAELVKNEALGVDYRISISDVRSTVTIVAPMGVKLNQQSQIARLIAAAAIIATALKGLRRTITVACISPATTLTNRPQSTPVGVRHHYCRSCLYGTAAGFTGRTGHGVKKSIAAELENRESAYP